jgi:hypothetical protein
MDVTSGNPQYKYFYGDDLTIAQNMKKAATQVAAGAKVAADWEEPKDL